MKNEIIPTPKEILTDLIRPFAVEGNCIYFRSRNNPRKIYRCARSTKFAPGAQTAHKKWNWSTITLEEETETDGTEVRGK